MFNLAVIIPVAILALVVISFIVTLAKLRRVVPTNMVHIVQSSKTTTPYGHGKGAGNTYYEWPIWVPKVGVSVTHFPESIIQIDIHDYEAYDSARLPFTVDLTAFFRVSDASVVSQRVANYNELVGQLTAVVKGAVRRTLATNRLEEIMEARSSLGDQFTGEVTTQIAEWGIQTAKNIEFMDLRDTNGSKVIANIMAKEKSRIEKESRVSVANNNQEAELKEIDATRTIEVQRQDAEQQIGLRTAEKNKTVGIAQEKSKQDVQEQAKVTTDREMDVKQVALQRDAEISKSVALTNADRAKQTLLIQAEADRQAQVIQAEADRQAVVIQADAAKQRQIRNAEATKESQVLDADGKKQAQVLNAQGAQESQVLAANASRDSSVLIAEGQKQASIHTAEGNLALALNEAKGVQAVGLAKAEADKAIGLAGVAPQIELADKIGGDEQYQNYLLSVEQIHANKEVGIATASALEKSDLKIISSGASDGNIMNSVGLLGKLFSPQTGISISSLLEGLKTTAAGKAIVDKLISTKE